ncbi:MAG: FKBP-type peptidyl-prolyl cis-trans isomerase [Bacteroidota bacterium]
MKPIVTVFLSLFLSILAPSHLVADCDCPEVEGFQADFCFSLEEIPGKCAQFKMDSDKFYFHPKGKKTVEIATPKVTDLDYFLDLANNKKLKLKAVDILFIQEALTRWEEKQLATVIELASGTLFKGDELTAMNFETQESGLGLNMLRQGNGKLPEKGKNVKVHYRGYLANGTVFDASYDRGQPIEFPLGVGRVIKGWDEGIALLPVGSRGILKIPAEIGYGNRTVGSIPANSTLYFDVFVADAQ